MFRARPRERPGKRTRSLWKAPRQSLRSFSRLTRKCSGLGFINKYNTYSILNELRWALDPDADFPRESIVQLTKTTWDDPHTAPTLEFADLRRNTRAPRANASGYKAHRELSRRDPNSWACRGVARCEGECIHQSNSHSIFLADRTRSIRISPYWFRRELGQSGGHTRAASHSTDIPTFASSLQSRQCP